MLKADWVLLRSIYLLWLSPHGLVFTHSHESRLRHSRGCLASRQDRPALSMHMWYDMVRVNWGYLDRRLNIWADIWQDRFRR